MVRRWLGVLSVALALLACPTVALAEDGSLLDSFTGGFTDTVSGEARETNENDPVRDYEYEPEVREVQTREVEETSPQSSIEQVTNSFNRLGWGESSTVTLYSAVRLFLGGANSSVSPVALFLPVAAGIVFMWWGVRKTIRILMSAFRSGRMSLGGSWSTSRYNPRSYYFGMRKRDL